MNYIDTILQAAGFRYEIGSQPDYITDYTNVTGTTKPEDNATNTKVFRQTAEPTNPTDDINDGDLWVDTGNGNQLFIYDTDTWIDAQDAKILEAYNSVVISTTTSIFSTDKDDATTPTNITLTANIPANFTPLAYPNGYEWTVSIDGGIYQAITVGTDVEIGEDVNTSSIIVKQFASGSKTFKVEVDDGVTPAEDFLTIQSLSDGYDTFVLLMGNENQSITVPFGTTGNLFDLIPNLDIELETFRGITQITTNCLYSITATTGTISASITDNGSTDGIGVLTIDTLTTDEASIEISSTVTPLGIVGKKVFTINKVFEGDTGIDGDNAINSRYPSIYRLNDNTINLSSGTFADPLNGNIDWSYSVPSITADSDIVYVSTRILTSDGLSPQEASWAIPSIYANRVDGLDGDGVPGQAVRTANLYKLNDSTLTDPNAGTFASPITGNTDWSYSVPDLVSDGDKVYVATRTFTNDTLSPQDASWSTPTIYSWRADGVDGSDAINSRYPSIYRLNSNTISSTSGTFADPLNGNIDWSYSVPTMTADLDVVYTSTRIFTSDGLAPHEASWSTPAVYASRIDGTDGNTGSTGQAVRVANLYKLNDSTLTSTTGGTFASPITGNEDWSYSVPAISIDGDQVYVASRTFTDDTLSPQDATWSTPTTYSLRTDGTDGDEGLRTANGIVYLKLPQATEPTDPTASGTYSFTTGIITGLLTTWSQSPGSQATESDTYWSCTYTVTETGTGTGVGNVTFNTTSTPWINFDGIITSDNVDTNIEANPVVIDGSTFTSGSTYTGTLTATQVNAAGIAATNITAGTFDADVIYAGSVAANKITAGTITATVSINTGGYIHAEGNVYTGSQVYYNTYLCNAYSAVYGKVTTAGSSAAGASKYAGIIGVNEYTGSSTTLLAFGLLGSANHLTAGYSAGVTGMTKNGIGVGVNGQGDSGGFGVTGISSGTGTGTSGRSMSSGEGVVGQSSTGHGARFFNAYGTTYVCKSGSPYYGLYTTNGAYIGGDLEVAGSFNLTDLEISGTLTLDNGTNDTPQILWQDTTPTTTSKAFMDMAAEKLRIFTYYRSTTVEFPLELNLDTLVWKGSNMNVCQSGHDEIGATGLFMYTYNASREPGYQVAGSNLKWACFTTTDIYTYASSPSGTWRLLGYHTQSFSGRASVWQRIL